MDPRLLCSTGTDTFSSIPDSCPHSLCLRDLRGCLDLSQRVPAAPELWGTGRPVEVHWETRGISLGTISRMLRALTTHLSLLLQDYVFAEGDLIFQPGETRKEVQVSLLELTEIDTLLHNCQLKQFAIDLLHPKYGAKIGRYPQTTVTIADPGRGWQMAAGAGGPQQDLPSRVLQSSKPCCSP